MPHTVLQIDGDSYRMRTHHDRLATLRAGLNAPTKVGNSHDRTQGILAIVDKRRHSGYT